MLATGLQPPITFVLVSVNGYIIAVRYSRAPGGDWDGALLAHGSEPPNVFPVNLCFFDTTGNMLNAKMDSPSDHPNWVQ